MGGAAFGFWRASAQDKEDLRPYLQTMVLAMLLGTDGEHFDAVGNAFGFDLKVRQQL